jgi:hypothetical protein
MWARVARGSGQFGSATQCSGYSPSQAEAPPAEPAVSSSPEARCRPREPACYLRRGVQRKAQRVGWTTGSPLL